MAEYVFDESMKVVGADKSKMKVMQMDPEEGASALVEGSVDMACLFGGNSIKAALTVGTRLLTVQEARDAGITGIDITSVTNKFMKENPGMVRTFVEVTHEANARYKAGKSDMNVIAKDAEMKLADMKETIGGFKFLTPAETEKSMSKGGLLDSFLKGMGTPSGSVDTSFLPL
jgi:taurine transport system substrate-binding protein